MAHKYSTGPLENQVTMGAASHPASTTVWTKVLNNNECRSIKAKIRVFRLDGTKTLIDSYVLSVGPLSSGFHVSDVSAANEFEVQIGISPWRGAHDVLIGVFGKDETGHLNPSHRLVQQELTPIDELTPVMADPCACHSDTR